MASNVHGERQECDHASPLDLDGKLPLMPRAGPGYAARQDLAAFRDEVFEDLGLLIVDLDVLVLTEPAGLLFEIWPASLPG